MEKKKSKRIISMLLVIAWIMVVIPGHMICAAGVQENTGQAEAETLEKDNQEIITRQEFIALLMSALGEKKNEEKAKKLKFIDKNQIDSKLAGDIGAADALGILPEIKTSGKTYLRPKAPLTKRMSAYYMGRCLGLHMDLELEGLKDSDKIIKGCKPYVTALVKSGIMQADTEGRLEPKELMTWEAAKKLIKTASDLGYFQLSDAFIYAGGNEVGSKESDNLFFHVTGITRGESNDIIYVADTYHNQIKAIQDGTVTVLAGKKTQKDESGRCIGGYTDGSLTEAVFNRPSGIRAVKNGLLVVDTGNHVIRYVDLLQKRVTTYAGTGKAGFANGNRPEAMFSSPQGIDITRDGTIYIADTGNHCIRVISKSGTVTTLAGAPDQKGYQDGAAGAAQFNSPMGLVSDGANIYVADCGNQRIRQIANGTVRTVAGSGTEQYENTENYIGGFQNGPASQARFHNPVNITMDNNGNLYVSDEGNSMVRAIKQDVVTTVAGLGTPVNQKQFSWDNYLVNPSGLLVSADDGKLYVTDSFKNHVIRISVK